MAKRTLNVDMTGPLFEDHAPELLASAINEGLRETGREAAGVLVGFIVSTGFEATGAFARSVEDELRTRSLTEPGYVKVGVTDAWPVPHRPTRTWGERGERGGVKLRKGLGMFSKTQRRVSDFSFDNIEAAIERRLN